MAFSKAISSFYSCSKNAILSVYLSNNFLKSYFSQGPAELPSDWNKNPHGPEEDRLNQRQASCRKISPTTTFLRPSKVHVKHDM